MRGVWVALAILQIFGVVQCAEEASTRASAEQTYWNNLAAAEINLHKQQFEAVKPSAVAKNVILFLGDGAGVGTFTAARTLKAQLNKERPGHPRLKFEEFPFNALVQTYNTDKMGPDSAGTATAYLCGVKGNLGTLGVDERVQLGNCRSYTSRPDSTIKCAAEYFAEAGKAIGLVTTKSVTDASPAPIYAHSPDRDWESDRELPAEAIQNGCRDIAVQLIDSAPYVNVVLGGGSNYFSPTYRRDKRDLATEWVAKKTQAGRKPVYVKTGTALRAVNTATTTDLFGLFSPTNMLYDQDRISQGSDQPSITEMALKALEVVQHNPNGYFLFIEGAKIDYAHHLNLANQALYETLAFENAIIEVLKKVDTSNTLVLVTADHSHVFTYGSYTSRDNFISDPSDDGTDTRGKKFTNMVYANGPGFAISNTGERPVLTAEQTNKLYYPFETAVPLLSETHSCEDVALYAVGPQAHLVNTLIEQNTVAHLMMHSSCVGPYATASHCPRAAETKSRKGMRSS